MPWCPKCKNEYYEGIKVCADCGTELVDSLDEWEKCQNAAREDALKEELAAYSELSKEAENDGEGSAETEEAAGNEKKETEETFRGVYQNYEEKAADNRSSAYTLLGVGTLGIAAIILCFCDVIKLPLNESTRYMILGILGAMFLFFVIMGLVSMKNAGKYAKKAESEKELTRELEKWFVEYVTAEKVDDGLFAEEEAAFSEEQKYFKRFDKMKELLSERFLNLNEGYMDRFLDKHYQDIFDGDK
ncbi:MAG: hypothetical protein K2P64_02650 [Lachnospiraceae bacterium]|nr:hypothetical protein [Lachnospiraceae bacterium]